MQAAVGDRLRISGHHVGEPDRCGEVMEVRGPDGTPPWMIHWDDTDHTVLFFPGSDARVEHIGPTKA